MRECGNMGVDYYYLSESINKENGSLAQNILSEIIDVIEDDKGFKEQRIERIVDRYQRERQEL